MSKNSTIAIIFSLFLIAVGCASGTLKPGTGGTKAAKEIENTDHPKFPDGVACYVCHKEDIPAQEFHANFGRKCEQCHIQTTWMAQNYPHAEWPLNEVHKVRCTRCHTKAAEYDFKTYQCYGCHHEEQNIKQSHANLNANNLSQCADCHKGFPAGETTK